MLRDIDLFGDHRAVQALVEQEVGVRRQLLPRRERARLLMERLCFGIVVQVLAPPPAPAARVSGEQLA